MRSIPGILASVAAFGLSPAQAVAGTFSISPLRAELSSRTPTAALTLRNQESTAVVVQAEVLLWVQEDGVDRLTPSRDVLVSPAVFTVAPNASQLVRLALRRAPDTNTELSYRLILTEVPQQASPDFNGLNVALRLSLPVFVDPATAGPAGASLEWSAARDATGGIVLTARNSGNTHARVLGFAVTPLDGAAPSIPQDVAVYILPGQTRTWTLGINDNEPKSSTDWHRLRMKGSSEAGEFEVEMPLAEP